MVSKIRKYYIIKCKSMLKHLCLVISTCLNELHRALWFCPVSIKFFMEVTDSGFLQPLAECGMHPLICW